MKALITGQAGFVGAYLAEHLDACGDEVVPFTAGGPVDVTEADGVHAAIGDQAVDVVYHLAALTHVGDSWDAPAKVWRVNTEGTLNVLRAAAHAGARVIVVSSAEVYGRRPEGTLLDETLPPQPLSPYGASKAAAELLALQAARGADTDAIVTRSFNHTGPGQPAQFVVPALAARVAQAARTGTREIVVGNLDAVRDLSHVRDVVAAYRTLAEHGARGEIYNVSSARPVSVREIAETFIAAAGGGMELVVDPALVRPVEVPYLVGDNTKLREATDWRPEYDLESTLADVLRAAQDALNVSA